MIKKLVCLFCFLSTALMANLRETSHVEDILPEISADTLVLFDIDDTLVQPTYFITHRQWKKFLRAQLAELYPKDIQKQFEVYGTTNLIVQLYAPLILVDTKTPNLIDVLQKQGIEVFAFTSRGKDYWYSYPVPRMDQRTFNHLRKVGIHFEKTPLKHGFASHPGFGGGIIFTKNEDKGPYLVKLLNHIGYRPNKVVFVDDHPDQVESVVQALEKEGIACEGFIYRAASDKPFNMTACAAQFKQIYSQLRLVNNDEALKISSSMSNVDPKLILLDYLDHYHEKLKHVLLSGKL